MTEFDEWTFKIPPLLKKVLSQQTTRGGGGGVESCLIVQTMTNAASTKTAPISHSILGLDARICRALETS